MHTSNVIIPRISTINDYYRGPVNYFNEKIELSTNYLSFENLSVTAASNSFFKRLGNSKENVTTILQPMSGTFPSGTIYALMGSSGSGKTTLMNALSGNSQKNMVTSGIVKYNNQSINIMNISAYIQQIDLFCTRLTVKEHLKFQIQLQLSRNTTNEERKTMLKWLIDNFYLERCSKNIIGDGFKIKGISGGEKKRLSVASEIIKKPAIIFADEPTTGLDSYMAENVIKSLKNMAHFGAIVICTIHQPSSLVFNMFNGVCLLSSGNLIACEKTNNIFQILKKSGYKISLNSNPADFLISCVSVTPNSIEESQNRIVNLKKNSEQMFPWRRPTPHTKSQKIFERKNSYNASILCQFGQLLRREMIVSKREPTLTFTKFLINILMGVLCGSLYYDTSFSITDMANLMGAMYFITIVLSFQNLFGVLNIFPLELDLYNREQKNLLYRPTLYFISKIIQEIPIVVVTTALYTVITYFMIGLKISVFEFFIFLVVCIIISECSISFGYVISTLCGDVKLSAVIAAPFAILLLLFGGFVVKQSDIPIYYQWLSYLSWFKYAFELLTIIQMKNTTIICDDLNFYSCQNNKEVDSTIVYEQFGLKEKNFNMDIIGIVLLTVGYRLIAYIILMIKYRKSGKTNK